MLLVDTFSSLRAVLIWSILMHMFAIVLEGSPEVEVNQRRKG